MKLPEQKGNSMTPRATIAVVPSKLLHEVPLLGANICAYCGRYLTLIDFGKECPTRLAEANAKADELRGEAERAQPIAQDSRSANFIQRLPGGYCFAHGKYETGFSCPQWPECLNAPCLTCDVPLVSHRCSGPKGVAVSTPPVASAPKPRCVECRHLQDKHFPLATPFLFPCSIEHCGCTNYIAPAALSPAQAAPVCTLKWPYRLHRLWDGKVPQCILSAGHEGEHRTSDEHGANMWPDFTRYEPAAQAVAGEPYPYNPVADPDFVRDMEAPEPPSRYQALLDEILDFRCDKCGNKLIEGHWSAVCHKPECIGEAAAPAAAPSRCQFGCTDAIRNTDCPTHSPAVPPQENACQDCGVDNPVWYAPNDVWNKVFPERVGFVCPNCFLTRAGKMLPTICWKLFPETESDRQEAQAGHDRMMKEFHEHEKAQNQSTASSSGEIQDAKPEVSSQSQSPTSERSEDSRETLAAPAVVTIPQSLAIRILEFLNRRMERDRWQNDQHSLREAIQDCQNPERERADDYCGFCHGTGKTFNSKDEYTGVCFCVRPAYKHPSSVVYIRAAHPVSSPEKGSQAGSY